MDAGDRGAARARPSSLRSAGRWAQAATALRGRRDAGIALALAVLLSGMFLWTGPLQGRDAAYFAGFGESYAREIAAPSIAAVGQTLVLLTGNIDISVGANLTLSATVAGKTALWAETRGFGGLSGLALVAASAMACGAAFGAVNGYLTGFARAPGIVVTLGTLSIGRALLLIWTGGEWVHGFPAWLRGPSQGSWLGIPGPLWMVAATAGLVALFVGRVRAGRRLYAVGGNRRAAALSGIRVSRQIFLAYTLCGLLTGLAAAVETSRASSIDANLGQGFELKVIAAAVIGGASIFGGEATILGAIAGAAFLEGVRKAIFAFGIPAVWENVFIGAAILLAVAFDVWRSRIRRPWRSGGRRRPHAPAAGSHP